MVGAGVSGCACAATLSGCGVPVTVMNSALDAVGRPSYGPVVDGGPGGWNRVVGVLQALPQPLRSVWIDSSGTPDLDAGFFVVDRRMLSIETKRVLEQMPGLEFRQGLVTDLRYAVPEGAPGRSRRSGGEAESESETDDPRRLCVGTAFGEVIEADMVILAVGMSLGGRVRVGDFVIAGGRYGEVSMEGLRFALEALGAGFAERSVEVGPSYAARAVEAGVEGKDLLTDRVEGERRSPGRRARFVPLRKRLEAAGGARMLAETPGCAWPEGYPPAPHWDQALRSDAIIVTGHLGGPGGQARPWLSPDGTALGEMYSHPGLPGSGAVAADTGCVGAGSADTGSADTGSVGAGSVGAGSEESGLEESGGRGEAGANVLLAGRLGHTVIGQTVSNADATGRLVVEGWPDIPVWVCGRAGGAVDYLDSLASGVRTGLEVAKAAARLGRCGRAGV